MQRRLHIRPARSYAPASSRDRVWYSLLTIAVMAIGLLWRSGFIALPPVVSKYGGDALWSLMIFVGFGFLFPFASTRVNALLAISFSWSVEFSQLYHAPWIDAVRSTLPGRLVLGHTFNWLDLPAYTFGVSLGAWLEHSFKR